MNLKTYSQIHNYPDTQYQKNVIKLYDGIVLRRIFHGFIDMCVHLLTPDRDIIASQA